MDTKKSDFSMTEMETALAADRDGTYRNALLARLADLETEIRAKVQRGLPRDAYEGWAAALTATTVARDVLIARGKVK